MRKLLFLVLILLYSCSSSSDSALALEPCGDFVIENQTIYDATDISNYTTTDVNVLNNCITVRITSSGCDGNSWTASLIDSEQETLSIPPERFLRLELTNNEACQSVFERSYTFDISTIRVTGSGTLVLNLDGWNSPIVIN